MFRGPRLLRSSWLARLFPGERLSGVLSTTEFQQAFLRERSLVDRRQRPFALIAFVPAGDHDPRALPRLARLLRERLRTADVVGRLNADHLASLLPATDGRGAWVVAESILHRLAAAGLKFDCKVYVYPCEAPDRPEADERRAGTGREREASPHTNGAVSAHQNGSSDAESPAADRDGAADRRPHADPADERPAAVAGTPLSAATATARAVAARPAPAPAAPTRAPDFLPIEGEGHSGVIHQLVAALPAPLPRDQARPAPARLEAREPADVAGVIVDRHGELRSGPYTDALEGSRELDAIRVSAGGRVIEDLRPHLVEPLPLWKRGMDVAVSAVALTALAPLFLVIAVAIKLDSEGPVIFKQKRAGAGGRPFTFYKFRSMHRDAEARRAALEALNEKDGPIFKIKNDPRLTRVGGFLRKWSLDELPQIYNVLRGDMSLVGPRPPTLNELPGYEAWQRRRLELTGGLTCIWQVSGRSDVSFEEWMRMDLRYARRRTLGQDILLICKTAGAIVSGRGAY